MSRSTSRPSDALVHDCWICRTVVRHAECDLARDQTFILGYVIGYAEGKTRTLGTVDWADLATCEKHQSMGERTAAAVRNSMARSTERRPTPRSGSENQDG